MKKIYLIILLMVAGQTLANPNNSNNAISDAYQATLDTLCPTIEKLAKKLYNYADWGITYNTAIVHVKKSFYKVVPEGTLGREQLELELENSVEYVLISHNQHVGLTEVINTTTQSCYSTFENTIKNT